MMKNEYSCGASINITKVTTKSTKSIQESTHTKQNKSKTKHTHCTRNHTQTLIILNSEVAILMTSVAMK